MNKFELMPNCEEEFTIEKRLETNHLFAKHFEDLNYLSVKPFPMVPRELDKSVLFTGSVTTPFKNYIMGSVPENSAFVIQPCFRAHNIKSFYNDEMPEFCSTFTGIGLVSRPEHYDKLCLDTLNFLTKKLKVEPDNILVKLTNRDSDINDYWLNQKGINKQIDSESCEYYRWKYGIEGIYGRGMTMAIRKNKDYDYQDVGNVIKIKKNLGEELAVEVGFGTETLLTRVYGLPHPISAFPVKEMIPNVDSDQKMVKIGDALMAIAGLSCAGVNPGQGNLDRILRRYIKGLDFILEKDNLSWNDMFPVLNKITKGEYPNNNPQEIEGSVKKYVDTFQEFKKMLVAYVNEVYYNKTVKRSSLPEFVTKFSENKGIPTPHMDLILNRNFEKNVIDAIKVAGTPNIRHLIHVLLN